MTLGIYTGLYLRVFYDIYGGEIRQVHNAASADLEVLLREDLKDIRPYLLKRFLFFIDI